MDYEFIRFRIDPAIHKKAADSCSRLGIELNDVLRALVTLPRLRSPLVGLAEAAD
jgi:antitoxin component of RelBE/YafQ-DinJ toxin-antitoxin module